MYSGQKTLKSVVFVIDFSAKIFSRTEVAHYVTPMLTI